MIRRVEPRWSVKNHRYPRSGSYSTFTRFSRAHVQTYCPAISTGFVNGDGIQCGSGIITAKGGPPQSFKWIKQHLRIKSFYGTSENAVKTQIWIAISIYILVAIVKKQLKLEISLYTFLQILSLTMFEKDDIFQLVKEGDYNTPADLDSNQLNLFDL